MSQSLTWHKIADHINELNFGSNNIATADFRDRKVCIGLFKERLFAFSTKCPHAGGSMADGYIDALGNVVCPLHRYKFDLENGRNVSGEGYYLKNWPVEVREDGVYIGQDEARGFWNIFR